MSEYTRPDVDLTYTSGNTLYAPEISRERIFKLGEVGQLLATTLPGYIGMTLYGSTARGEATADSDIDLFAFIDPDSLPLTAGHVGTDELCETVYSGATQGTVRFKPHTSQEDTLFQTVNGHVKAAVPVGLDLDLIPLNSRIVEETTDSLLRSVASHTEGNTENKKLIPRNIRALFHLAADAPRLQPYIHQALTKLAQDPHGEMAWSWLRHMVVGFEQGRSQTDNLRLRSVPSTLNEAIQEYS
jgi:hypothetical protein